MLKWTSIVQDFKDYEYNAYTLEEIKKDVILASKHLEENKDNLKVVSTRKSSPNTAFSILPEDKDFEVCTMAVTLRGKGVRIIYTEGVDIDYCKIGYFCALDIPLNEFQISGTKEEFNNLFTEETLSVFREYLK